MGDSKPHVQRSLKLQIHNFAFLHNQLHIQSTNDQCLVFESHDWHQIQGYKNPDLVFEHIKKQSGYSVHLEISPNPEPYKAQGKEENFKQFKNNFKYLKLPPLEKEGWGGF